MELIVKIQSNGANPQYQDGDVVQAMSLDRIYMTHAKLICHPRNFGFNTFGLRDRNTLLEKCQELIHKHKFERMNSNDVKRTNLITGEETILNTIPNSDGHYINAYQYISRRIKHPEHKIFGTHGTEVWYDKPRKRESSIITSLWNEIETHTDSLKDNHGNWPFTDLEKRHFICINTSGRSYDGDSFTRVELSDDTVCERHVTVDEVVDDTDPNNIVINLQAKRKWFVPYWDLTTELGSSVDDLRNPDHMCDCRKPMDEREHIDILTYDKITEGLL